MSKRFSKIISMIKSFPLIDGEWLEFPKDASDLVAFYKIFDGRKVMIYDFELKNKIPNNELVNNSDFSELVISNAEKLFDKYFSKYIPQDTYVVFISEIENHTDDLQKFIIRIEENEFMFKKYVCLYTDDELLFLQNALKNMNHTKRFWDNENLFNNRISLSLQLLPRLAIKLPIIQLDFAEISFNSVQNRVNKDIDHRENGEQMRFLNESLDSWIGEITPEEIANDMVNEIMAGEQDEI
ncbi:hypothetical protein JZO70_14060 [Enterococcus sp. 669A]|uniref:Uncharacterized protein n=1 Tax=Candidatus Enterococcus moelleringii TaxID=2815325 RepID=A0ABS3LCD8_9ENTE|nr:ABC-three component system middle component 1 [Enterococcus sp. 669A]MBO1307298.1 hypothetical protein [Enterococcus sp. 669A]